MTDQYGSGSPEGHEGETHTDHGNDPGHPESETWQDDRPPFDDFENPDQSAEGEASAVQETEPVAGDETQAPANGGKSKFMPIMAAVGGLLFLGVIAWWQFGRSPAAPPPSPMMAALQQPSKAAMSKSPASNVVDMKALYEPASNAPPPPPPSPAQMPSSPSSMRVAPTTSFAPPGSADESAGPSALSASVPAAPASPLPSAAPQGAEEARLEALTTQVNELKGRLDHLGEQLSQLHSALAVNPGLGNELNQLQQQLLKLEHDKETRMGGASAAATGTTPEATHHAERHEAVHEIARHARIRVLRRHKTRKASAGAATHVHSWVLRAATLREAWVSASATSSELRHVAVGDHLPGIGRVTAIRQTTGGGWIIEGTQGDVR